MPTVKELQAIAKARGIPYSGLRKAELEARLAQPSSSKCEGKVCPNGQVCNPKTGRCVKKSGKIGQSVLEKKLELPVPMKLIIDDKTLKKLLIAEHLYEESNVVVPTSDILVDILELWRSRILRKSFKDELKLKMNRLDPYAAFVTLVHANFPPKNREKFDPKLTTLTFIRIFKRGLIKNRIMDEATYENVTQYLLSHI